VNPVPSEILIFDGVCNLCARSVQFIVAHEAAPRLSFTPLQSAAGNRLMRELGFDPQDAKTFVLIADGKAYVKSDAAIRVVGYFRGSWRLLAAVRILPRVVRDWLYDRVASNRYQWFGRTEQCMLPTPQLRQRFYET
jgi:predicted DCC family thiol-disulfide oxidoreductase YuxK